MQLGMNHLIMILAMQCSIVMGHWSRGQAKA